MHYAQGRSTTAAILDRPLVQPPGQLHLSVELKKSARRQSGPPLLRYFALLSFASLRGDPTMTTLWTALGCAVSLTLLISFRFILLWLWYLVIMPVVCWQTTILFEKVLSLAWGNLYISSIYSNKNFLMIMYRICVVIQGLLHCFVNLSYLLFTTLNNFFMHSSGKQGKHCLKVKLCRLHLPLQ